MAGKVLRVLHHLLVRNDARWVLQWKSRACRLSCFCEPLHLSCVTAHASFFMDLSFLICKMKKFAVLEASQPLPTLSVVVVQSLSHVWLFVTPWTAAGQVSLSFTISQSFLKLMSIESVMPSNHLVLCHPLLLLPSIFLFFIWKDRHLPYEIDYVHIHTASSIPNKAHKPTVYNPHRKGNKSNLTHHPSVC